MDYDAPMALLETRPDLDVAMSSYVSHPSWTHADTSMEGDDDVTQASETVEVEMGAFETEEPEYEMEDEFETAEQEQYINEYDVGAAETAVDTFVVTGDDTVQDEEFYGTANAAVTDVPHEDSEFLHAQSPPELQIQHPVTTDDGADATLEHEVSDEHVEDVDEQNEYVGIHEDYQPHQQSRFEEGEAIDRHPGHSQEHVDEETGFVDEEPTHELDHIANCGQTHADHGFDEHVGDTGNDEADTTTGVLLNVPLGFTEQPPELHVLGEAEEHNTAHHSEEETHPPDANGSLETHESEQYNDVTGSGRKLLEDDADDPLMLSEGVYIDPPPPVLFALEDNESELVLFTMPTPLEGCSTKDASIQVLLGSRPTLYYEPITTFFQALREEVLAETDYDGYQLSLVVYSLDLTVNEDDRNNADITLHDLGILHDGLGHSGHLQLSLIAQHPRFITRYLLLKSKLENSGPEDGEPSEDTDSSHELGEKRNTETIQAVGTLDSSSPKEGNAAFESHATTRTETEHWGEETEEPDPTDEDPEYKAPDAAHNRELREFDSEKHTAKTPYDANEQGHTSLPDGEDVDAAQTAVEGDETDAQPSKLWELQQDGQRPLDVVEAAQDGVDAPDVKNDYATDLPTHESNLTNSVDATQEALAQSEQLLLQFDNQPLEDQLSNIEKKKGLHQECEKSQSQSDSSPTRTKRTHDESEDESGVTTSIDFDPPAKRTRTAEIVSL